MVLASGCCSLSHSKNGTSGTLTTRCHTTTFMWPWEHLQTLSHFRSAHSCMNAAESGPGTQPGISPACHLAARTLGSFKSLTAAARWAWAGRSCTAGLNLTPHGRNVPCWPVTCASANCPQNCPLYSSAFTGLYTPLQKGGAHTGPHTPDTQTA